MLYKDRSKQFEKTVKNKSYAQIIQKYGVVLMMENST